MLTSNCTKKWIENLAEQELLIKAGERASIDICTTKEEVLTSETASFIQELFVHFENLVGLFNARVNQASLQMKLVRSPEGVEGISVARNQMRLQLTAVRPGVIQIHCHKWASEDPHKPMVMFSALIESQFETFDDVAWFFLGNQITAEQVARHYLTEFIQATRTSH